MPDPDRQKRFILVDPSFDGTAGDKWQYAMTFAKSAVRNGYQFILLSNIRSPLIGSALEDPIDERAIFDFTFYEHSEIVSRHHMTPKRKARRATANRVKAALGDISSRIDRASERGDPGLVAALESEKKQMLRSAARQARVDIADFEPLMVPFNRDDFAVALARELADIQLSSGDQIFFHTFTPGMLESLSEVTAQLGAPAPLDVDAHFLFHFGREASDAATFLDRYHSYSHMDSVVSRLRTGTPFQRIHLLATSEDLVAECESMFQTPVGLFEGLTDLDTYLAASGGAEETSNIRRSVRDTFTHDRKLVVGIRASDVLPEVMAALRRSEAILSDFKIALEINILYSENSRPALREIISARGDLNLKFVDTTDNDNYIQALVASQVMILTYVAERYKKRVSAVLHDCSVLGVTCIVPENTTLAKSRDYANIYTYVDINDIAGLLVLAARQLDSGETDARLPSLVEVARAKFSTDVITRLLGAQSVPSLVVTARPRIATVIMPCWERCGSTFAMESQVRYLVDAGYFVIQLFVLDKAADQFEATSWFWTILRHNSTNARGNVQRIAFADASRLAELATDPDYLNATAFDQYLRRLGESEVRDPVIESLAGRSEITLVNHVFNSVFADKIGGGVKILESHDIQAYQMVRWPIVSAMSNEPAALSETLAREFAVISEYDFVINVAPEEHTLISLANPASALITPYLPEPVVENLCKTAGELADLWGLDDWYRTIDVFDIMLAGDAHPANVESAVWFVESIFKPFLAGRGVTFVVAGRLSQVLYERFGSIAGVFYIGFVKDLEQVRKLSRVTILPDIRGTGISIKTLEAFASGSPFVATQTALRGLESRLPKGLAGVDNPEAFAEQVLMLLQSPEALALSGRTARLAYEAVASRDRFVEAWNDVLDALAPQIAERRHEIAD